MMDRIMTQIRFKRVLWTCPKCGQEDFEDRNMSGGQSYEHSCSVCLAKFNQSGTNMREYNGVICYTPEEYKTLKDEDLIKTKQVLVDKWLYEVKNPPPYIEPTPEELQAEIDAKQQEIDSLMARIEEAKTKIKEK